MASIAKEYKKLTGKAITGTTNTSTNAVTTGYDANWFAMEQVEGRLAFGNINVDAIRASVYSEYSCANFITRYGNLYQSTVDKVAQAITRGIVTGQGYAKTSMAVKDIFGLSYSDTIRIIRTESQRAFTEGALKSYERAKEQGIEGVVTWLSTFDGRTRPDHARLNGKEADKNGLFHIGSLSADGPGHWGDASQDIQCRCTTYYKLDGVEGLPNWSYKTWEKKYGKWQKEPAKRK
jgi:SPP1 gp7 family putative phage head morphogenesis protein